MTSEVLILNKRAIVIGADSAVTTSNGSQPRYSKTANKIFEISKNGNVAAAIYGNAAIDSVPWELILKMFRNHLGGAKLSKLSEYSAALSSYLSGNDKLFPKEMRVEWTKIQFDLAIKEVIEDASRHSAELLDENVPMEERKLFWGKEAKRMLTLLKDRGVAASLSQLALDAVLQDLPFWAARAQEQLNAASSLSAIDANELAELGHWLRYVLPHWILSSTGVVVAGYGEEQIFPAYEQLEIYGHIGDELYFKNESSFEVGHASTAMIKPLAQTSMIDMFTDGFGPSLETIISEHSEVALDQVFKKLEANGVVVSQELKGDISKQCHQQFMADWKLENWKKNFHPLLGVLQSVSVDEMAHLAESLLGLESLKERVTSSSESVGGPIDVAAITKSEGLVWIRRKHFFDAGLNLRYAARLERSFD